MKWHGLCHRCLRPVKVHTMSKFNIDLICMDCDETERKHPDYQEAVEAEVAAIKRGDLNFPGIGWPRPKNEDQFKL